MRDLSELRKEIDELDKRMIEVLAKRMQVVKEVGKYKKANDIAPLAPERWQQVLDSRAKIAQGLGVDKSMVTDILEIIHQYALKLEAETPPNLPLSREESFSTKSKYE